MFQSVIPTVHIEMNNVIRGDNYKVGSNPTTKALKFDVMMQPIELV